MVQDTVKLHGSFSLGGSLIQQNSTTPLV